MTIAPATVALFGAAGKVGTRIAGKLRQQDAYRTLYVEKGEAGLALLRDRGLIPSPQERAVREAEIILLAIPDMLIVGPAQKPDRPPRLEIL